jgi:hypothetical protein
MRGFPKAYTWCKLSSIQPKLEPVRASRRMGRTYEWVWGYAYLSGTHTNSSTVRKKGNESTIFRSSLKTQSAYVSRGRESKVNSAMTPALADRCEFVSRKKYLTEKKHRMFFFSCTDDRMHGSYTDVNTFSDPARTVVSTLISQNCSCRT